jgi:predicted ATPase
MNHIGKVAQLAGINAEINIVAASNAETPEAKQQKEKRIEELQAEAKAIASQVVTLDLLAFGIPEVMKMQNEHRELLASLMMLRDYKEHVTVPAHVAADFHMAEQYCDRLIERIGKS